ncbi:transcription antitermination factor NusB [Campylobacter corcagiensis]|uniref:Transcription antitermination protein NusB n=1 Tax=Campylobacter corcagiensis TaxID=1448857 RepID=A0A7M1LG66_9BACT|nr:transcription antitermination factor NusB [Campylobacter corcagiensis]QKF64217.1 transcription antitermination protein [Campylobacter corcagiensis]QOQ87589.1 transcription antitermination factor NusB [Campylobacter corcagiensis]
MATRHQVRQAVVSLLYAKEMGNDTDEFRDEFLEEHKIRNKQREFTKSLFKGVVNNIKSLDESLDAHLDEYKVKELGVVERAILRLGAYEILHTQIDTPIVINEGIELAKEMASDTSPKFINAVLDAVGKESK